MKRLLTSALLAAALALPLAAAPAATTQTTTQTTTTTAARAEHPLVIRLRQAEQAAYAAEPRLAEIERKHTQQQADQRQKQDASRRMIDRYLRDKKLGGQDLLNFRLKGATDLLMRITPAQVAAEPELRELVVDAFKRGEPAFPEAFARDFPGQKPADVPADKLLEWHLAQYAREATDAQTELDALVKAAGTPSFMIDSLREICRSHYRARIYRAWLAAHTPPELLEARKAWRAQAIKPARKSLMR